VSCIEAARGKDDTEALWNELRRRCAVPVLRAVEGVSRYRDVGVQLFIGSIYQNDTETQELLATEVMPHFA
jgi:hypothetical protein